MADELDEFLDTLPSKSAQKDDLDDFLDEAMPSTVPGMEKLSHIYSSTGGLPGVPGPPRVKFPSTLSGNLPVGEMIPGLPSVVKAPLNLAERYAESPIRAAGAVGRLVTGESGKAGTKRADISEAIEEGSIAATGFLPKGIGRGLVKYGAKPLVNVLARDLAIGSGVLASTYGAGKAANADPETLRLMMNVAGLVPAYNVTKRLRGGISAADSAAEQKALESFSLDAETPVPNVPGYPISGTQTVMGLPPVPGGVVPNRGPTWRAKPVYPGPPPVPIPGVSSTGERIGLPPISELPPVSRSTSRTGAPINPDLPTEPLVPPPPPPPIPGLSGTGSYIGLPPVSTLPVPKRGPSKAAKPVRPSVDEGDVDIPPSGDAGPSLPPSPGGEPPPSAIPPAGGSSPLLPPPEGRAGVPTSPPTSGPLPLPPVPGGIAAAPPTPLVLPPVPRKAARKATTLPPAQPTAEPPTSLPTPSAAPPKGLPLASAAAKAPKPRRASAPTPPDEVPDRGVITAVKGSLMGSHQVGDVVTLPRGETIRITKVNTDSTKGTTRLQFQRVKDTPSPKTPEQMADEPLTLTGPRDTADIPETPAAAPRVTKTINAAPNSPAAKAREGTTFVDEIGVKQRVLGRGPVRPDGSSDVFVEEVKPRAKGAGQSLAFGLTSVGGGIPVVDVSDIVGKAVGGRIKAARGIVDRWKSGRAQSPQIVQALSTRVMEQAGGPDTQKAYQAYAAGRDWGAQEAGPWNAKFKQAKIESLNPAERYDAGLVLAGKKPKPMNGKTARAVLVMDAAAKDLLNKASQAGVMVELSSGEKIPIQEAARRLGSRWFVHRTPSVRELERGPVREDMAVWLANEYPETIKSQKIAKDFIDKQIRIMTPGTEAMGRNDIPKDLVDLYRIHNKKVNGITLSDEQAREFMVAARENRDPVVKGAEVGGGPGKVRHGSLESMREANSPFYDRDAVRAMQWHVNHGFRRLGLIKHLGQENEFLNAELAKLADKHGDAKTAAKFLDRMITHVSSSEDPAHAFFRGWMALQNLKLALTALPNSAQFLTTALKADKSTLGRALWGLRKAENRMFGTESGALSEISRGFHDEAFNTTITNYLKTTGHYGTEVVNRVVAANVGREHARTMASRLLSNPSGAFARNELRSLGVDPDAVLKQRGRLTPEQERTAGLRLSDLTQGRHRVEDMPELASGGILGRMIWKFKQFGYNQARLAIDSTYGDARRAFAKGVSPQDRAQYLKRFVSNLFKLGVVAPVIGDAIRSARDAVTGREDRDDLGGPAEWMKLLEQGDKGKLFHKYALGLLNSGATGFLADFIQSTAYNNLLSWGAGPGFSSVADVGQRLGDVAFEQWKSAWGESDQDTVNEKAVSQTKNILYRHGPYGPLVKRMIEGQEE